jgi:hypothetical protein
MSVATFVFRDEADDIGRVWYWLDLVVDEQLFDSIPFDSAEERQRARDDFVETVLQAGGRELPPLDPRKLS